LFFFSSRRRHTIFSRDWSSDVCSSDLTNKGITISAVLYFNNKGQLINFISDDRTDVSDMKQYRFSTPVHRYKNINGMNILAEGEIGRASCRERVVMKGGAV